ncbi:MAG TPA: DNA repair protein RadC [Gemmatimonadaceae bacterium]|nr:DNA repair protein RadC [Gemmatimonadaceae bacterium]
MPRRKPLHPDHPVERLCTLGAEALSIRELLAVILGEAAPTLAVEGMLNAAHGSLRTLAQETASGIAKQRGLSVLRAATIVAAFELGKRRATEDVPTRQPLRSPRDVVALFAPQMEDLPVEELRIALLDSQHKVSAVRMISRGILNSALVHPREVFAPAVAERASAIVVVHNHPSGDPTPSPDDRAITSQLVAAGRLLDVPVGDHIILGKAGRYFSFAEGGVL